MKMSLYNSQAVFVNGKSIMSEDELESEVLKGLADFGMEASDEDLTIIMGNVENWLTFTDCTISEAIKHTLNYEDPWND